MSPIIVSMDHQFEVGDLLSRVVRMTLEIAQEYNLQTGWREDNGRIIDFFSDTGITKGIRGYIELDVNKVIVEVMLPFGLLPMRRSIEEGIREHMTKAMGE